MGRILDEILAEVDRRVAARGGPVELAPVEYLRRVRLQASACIAAVFDAAPELCERLSLKVSRDERLSDQDLEDFRKVAEGRFPGLAGALDRLSAKEKELEKVVGEA